MLAGPPRRLEVSVRKCVALVVGRDTGRRASSSVAGNDPSDVVNRMRLRAQVPSRGGSGRSSQAVGGVDPRPCLALSWQPDRALASMCWTARRGAIITTSLEYAVVGARRAPNAAFRCPARGNVPETGAVLASVATTPIRGRSRRAMTSRGRRDRISKAFHCDSGCTGTGAEPARLGLQLHQLRARRQTTASTTGRLELGLDSGKCVLGPHGDHEDVGDRRERLHPDGGSLQRCSRRDRGLCRLRELHRWRQRAQAGGQRLRRQLPGCGERTGHPPVRATGLRPGGRVLDRGQLRGQLSSPRNLECRPSARASHSP